MNTFTQNQKEQIIKMYNDKIDIDIIINTFEFNEHDIRFILKENQIDRKYNAFTDELYQRIIFFQEKRGQMASNILNIVSILYYWNSYFH